MKKFLKITTIISLAISILLLSNVYTFAAPNKSNATNKTGSAKVTEKNKTELTPASTKKSSSSTEKKDNKVQTKKASTDTIEVSGKNTNSVNKKNISAPAEKTVKNEKKSNQATTKANNTPQTKKTENKKSITDPKQTPTQKEPSTEIKKTSNSDKNNLEIAIDDKDTADGFQSIQNNTQDQEDDCLYIKIIGIVFISLGSIGFLLSLYWLITKRKNAKNSNKKSDRPQKQKKERYKGTHFK